MATIAQLTSAAQNFLEALDEQRKLQEEFTKRRISDQEIDIAVKNVEESRSQLEKCLSEDIDFSNSLTGRNTVRMFIARRDEIRKDVMKLHEPGAITQNDGYYAKSLEEKYGVDLKFLYELVGTPTVVTTLEWK